MNRVTFPSLVLCPFSRRQLLPQRTTGVRPVERLAGGKGGRKTFSCNIRPLLGYYCINDTFAAHRFPNDLQIDVGGRAGRRGRDGSVGAPDPRRLRMRGEEDRRGAGLRGARPGRSWSLWPVRPAGRVRSELFSSSPLAPRPSPLPGRAGAGGRRDRIERLGRSVAPEFRSPSPWRGTDASRLLLKHSGAASNMGAHSSGNAR
jgi:hypothetical protein